MPETDTLGLDYCISTPEVQRIQSQPVHSEHVHSGTTSAAMLRLSGMCLWCVLPAMCRCDNTHVCTQLAECIASFSIDHYCLDHSELKH